MNDVVVDSSVIAEPSPVADILLSVKSVEAGYGDVKVLWGIDMTVNAGTVACIVGSNGAGKTTLLRTLSGLIKPGAGTVMFNGQDLTGASPEKVLSAGIAQVPEGRRLFKGLAVRDNLLLGAYLRRDPRADDGPDCDAQEAERGPAQELSAVDRPASLTTCGQLTADAVASDNGGEAAAASGAAEAACASFVLSALPTHRTRAHPQYFSQGMFTRAHLHTSVLQRPT